MLLHGSQLIGTPIMGLQTGSELAALRSPVINPGNLTIVAYVVEGPNLDQEPSLLLTTDIREFGEIGMIIDSNDEFVGSEDVIKLKPLYDLGFTPVGKHVVDQHHKKLGKVIDYTVDIDSFVIQQLSVKRPLLKALNDAELLIHRSQIVEINDTQIIVKSTAKKQGKATAKGGRSHYANPFRQNTPQPESAKSEQD